MIKLEDLVRCIEKNAPIELQEEWDNSGLQISPASDEINRILLALEITKDVIKEARDKNADMIITHHPLFFSPFKNILIEDAKGAQVVALLEDKRIGLYSAHTSFDSAEGGMNDNLAELCGLTDIKHIEISQDNITPEQTIPNHYIPVPWESNITIGNSFAYSYDDHYKTPRKLVQMLLEVVSKGGNLVLGVGAQGDGRLPRQAMESAKGLGKWLEKNERAIYNTRACAPYILGKWAGMQGASLGFTQSGDSVFVLRPVPKTNTLQKVMEFPWEKPVRKVLLMETGEALQFTPEGGTIRVQLPETFIKSHPYAVVLELLL